MQHATQPNPYGRLLAMTGLAWVSMYILMFAMVNEPSQIHDNLNQFYMAGLMAAPMLILELGLMHHMYPNLQLNVLLVSAATIVGLLCFMFIRQQTAISDTQFLRSMIPHHASAIHMCEHATLHDPDLRALCTAIRTNQQTEIDEMTAKLKMLEH